MSSIHLLCKAKLKTLIELLQVVTLIWMHQ